MAYPTRDESRLVLINAGVPGNVIEHIEVVTDLAVEIAGACEADMELVVAASMLHDIGRSVTHGIDHACVGADILRERGFPDDIVLIVEKHIGAGLTPDRAEELDLPPRDYSQNTLEQKVVAHADNLIKGHRRQKIAEHEAKFRNEGLDDAADRAVALHRYLSELCGFDLDELVE